jgi:hypothetical protein
MDATFRLASFVTTRLHVVLDLRPKHNSMHKPMPTQARYRSGPCHSLGRAETTVPHIGPFNTAHVSRYIGWRLGAPTFSSEIRGFFSGKLLQLINSNLSTFDCYSCYKITWYNSCWYNIQTSTLASFSEYKRRPITYLVQSRRHGFNQSLQNIKVQCTKCQQTMQRPKTTVLS